MVHKWIVYFLHHFLLSVCAFETVNRSSYTRNTLLRNKNIELVQQKRRQALLFLPSPLTHHLPPARNRLPLAADRQQLLLLRSKSRGNKRALAPRLAASDVDKQLLDSEPKGFNGQLSLTWLKWPNSLWPASDPGFNKRAPEC